MHGNEVSVGHCVLRLHAACYSRLEAGFLKPPAYYYSSLGTSFDVAIVIFPLDSKTISNVQLVRRDAPRCATSEQVPPQRTLAILMN